MNEYDKQATEFLESTQTKLDLQFTGTRPYFPGDKESRDTYIFTLTTPRGSYSGEFGDSIHDTERRLFALRDWQDRTDHEARKLGLCTPSGQISNQKISEARNHKPSAYSILACLDPYIPDTFEDFCADFGYNEDSRSALDTYLSCQKQANGLRRIYTMEQLEQLAEIQ